MFPFYQNSLFLHIKSRVLRFTMDTKDLLGYKAFEIFVRYGFRAVTMDDLAKEMSISKKNAISAFQQQGRCDQASTECLSQTPEDQNGKYSERSAKSY